jgi:hypothetical protein
MSARILSAVLAALVLLLIVSPAPADDLDYQLVEGFVTPLGYTYHNGLWYMGTQAYTRHKVYFTAYRTACNSYGCAYQQAYQDWRMEYTPYTAPTYPTPSLKYSSEWRTEGLRMLSARDDLNAFSNFVHENNLGGGYAISDKYPFATAYGGYGASSGYSNANLGGYGVNGTTVYGRGNFNSLAAALYNVTDINILNQQSARLTQNAQQLAGQAHSDHSAIVSQINDGARQVAVIQALAAGSAAAPVLAATSFTFGQDAASATPAPIMPRAPDDAPAAQPGATSGIAAALAAAWNDPGPDGCVKCHGDKAPAKGLTLAVWKTLSRSQKISHWENRLYQAQFDPKTAMPRNEAGVGRRLPDPKLQPFFDDIKSMKP